jgi:hypothetical protein
MQVMGKLPSRWSVVLIVLGSGGLGHPGVVQEPAARAQAPIGPLGHWKGDDGETPKTATDASGNGFHGTYSAGSGMSKEVPKTDFPNPGSINLDGATGVVTIPDSPALRITGDITIAFWKRRTAEVKDWTRLVGKGNGAQRNFGIWEYPNGEGRIKFQMYGQGGGSVLELDSPGNTVLNTWYHVVCVVSVNAAALYMNGALVANATRTGEPGTSADPLTFGHAGYHTFFPGQLDDIRIYDRALSMSEVVYLAGGHGPPAGPTGLAATQAAGQPVSLKWTASPTVPPAGTATYYVVRRSATPGSGHATVAWGLTQTTYTDRTADPKTAYSYLVTAINTGGESVPSNEITVPPPAK